MLLLDPGGATIDDARAVRKGNMDKVRKQIRFQVRSMIVPFEETNSPELEPLYANHFELVRVGSDIFLDIGILRPQDMLALVEQQEDGGVVDFYVLQRVAMTIDTLKRLRSKADDLCEMIDSLNANAGTPSEQAQQ